MEQIDARRALELLTDVVDQYGEDTVYMKVPLVVDGVEQPGQGTGCRYQFDGQASCLVGHALTRAGVHMNTLVSLDMNGTSADRMTWVVEDDDARHVFQAAQSVQDGGGTWGAALADARKLYERIQVRNG